MLHWPLCIIAHIRSLFSRDWSDLDIWRLKIFTAKYWREGLEERRKMSSVVSSIPSSRSHSHITLTGEAKKAQDADCGD
jgi:hypothetical protein